MDKKEIIKGILWVALPMFIIMSVFTALVYGKVINLFGFMYFLSNVILFILFIALLYLLLRQISSALNPLQKNLEKLSVGIIDQQPPKKRGAFFQFSEFRQGLNQLNQYLNKTAQAIDETANNTNEAYELQNEADALGKALVNLKMRLKENEKVLEKTKLEEQQRTWSANGLAKFGDILRQESHDLKQMGYDLISNLVDYIEFNQGALFVLNEEDGQETIFELTAAVAYNRQKVMEKAFKLGEGLVGRCAYEKKTIYMTEVPEEYVNITSGLGTANPRNILLVPCMLDDKVYSIIELASFNLIQDFQVEFIEKLGESIASSISSVRNNERTNALLEDSKKQSEELAAQEEELRQNLEEMEATQEDLKRQMDLNAEMREKLAYEKFLFDTLLEKIPSRIFFKDRESRFIKASQSLVKKFGKDNYEELAGLSDADLLDKEFAQKTMADERKIMESRNGLINFVEHEVTSTGDDIWKNVSKIPLINDNDECVGTFGIITDITEFKKAEIKSGKYKQHFEQLFKALWDEALIVKTDTNGLVIETNPRFNDYFNIDKSQVLNTNFSSVFKHLTKESFDFNNMANAIETDIIYTHQVNVKVEKTELSLALLALAVESNENGQHFIIIGIPQ